jgi:hypothetical protein
MVMQEMAVPKWQGFDIVLKCLMVQIVVYLRVCPLDLYQMFEMADISTNTDAKLACIYL